MEYDSFDEIRKLMELIDKIEKAMVLGDTSELEKAFEEYFGGIPNYRIFSMDPFGVVKLQAYGGTEKNRNFNFDSYEDDEKYAFTFQLPYLNQEPVVKAEKNTIYIDGGKNYKDVIKLEKEIDNETLSYTFKNGVLDIEVKKLYKKPEKK